MVSRNGFLTPALVNGAYLYRRQIHNHSLFKQPCMNRIFFRSTHIELIAIGIKEQVAIIVCSRSIRVICRSSQFVLCFTVRMLRIVRRPKLTNNNNGSIVKITGT